MCRESGHGRGLQWIYRPSPDPICRPSLPPVASWHELKQVLRRGEVFWRKAPVAPFLVGWLNRSDVGDLHRFGECRRGVDEAPRT